MTRQNAVFILTIVLFSIVIGIKYFAGYNNDALFIFISFFCLLLTTVKRYTIYDAFIISVPLTVLFKYVL